MNGGNIKKWPRCKAMSFNQNDFVNTPLEFVIRWHKRCNRLIFEISRRKVLGADAPSYTKLRASGAFYFYYFILEFGNYPIKPVCTSANPSPSTGGPQVPLNLLEA